MGSPVPRMAWRNLARNIRRTIITVAGLGLALAMSTSAWVLFDGFIGDSIDALVSSSGHVLVEHPGQLEQQNFYDTLEGTEALAAELAGHPDVAAVQPVVRGAALVSAVESAGASVRGLDPARDTSRLPKQLVHGRFLQAADEVVLGAQLAQRIEAAVGDDVAVMTQAADGSLGNALWRVVGLVETGNADQDRSFAWVTIGTAQEFFVLDGAHALALSLHDPNGATAFVSSLDDRFALVYADAGLEAPEATDPFRTPTSEQQVVARTWKSVNPVMGEYSAMSKAWALVTVGIVILTAAMGAMNTMLMSVLERTRELGVLMAVGLKPRSVVGLVVLENLALGAVSTVLGLGLGAILAWWLVDVGFDLSDGAPDVEFAGVIMEPVFRGRWSVDAFVWPTVVLAVVTFLSSLWPAVRAARLAPVDAMRAER